VERIPRLEYDPEGVLSEFIGHALMVVRLHRGTTQIDLASQMSRALKTTVTQGYISKVEKGRDRVSWSRLAIFCKCLECLPGHLIALAEFLADQSLRPERDIVAELLRRTPNRRSRASAPRRKKRSIAAK
jgi:transcriptional regulator with XRE-family HTH domain